ncbi:MAG: hypothetical protein ACPL7K_09500, partial [Armatimonadota bacterium]
PESVVHLDHSRVVVGPAGADIVDYGAIIDVVPDGDTVTFLVIQRSQYSCFNLRIKHAALLEML